MKETTSSAAAKAGKVLDAVLIRAGENESVGNALAHAFSSSIKSGQWETARQLFGWYRELVFLPGRFDSGVQLARALEAVELDIGDSGKTPSPRLLGNPAWALLARSSPSLLLGVVRPDSM